MNNSLTQVFQSHKKKKIAKISLIINEKEFFKQPLLVRDELISELIKINEQNKEIILGLAGTVSSVKTKKPRKIPSVPPRNRERLNEGVED